MGRGNRTSKQIVQVLIDPRQAFSGNVVAKQKPTIVAGSVEAVFIDLVGDMIKKYEDVLNSGELDGLYADDIPEIISLLETIVVKKEICTDETEKLLDEYGRALKDTGFSQTVRPLYLGGSEMVATQNSSDFLGRENITTVCLSNKEYSLYDIRYLVSSLKETRMDSVLYSSNSIDTKVLRSLEADDYIEYYPETTTWKPKDKFQGITRFVPWDFSLNYP